MSECPLPPPLSTPVLIVLSALSGALIGCTILLLGQRLVRRQRSPSNPLVIGEKKDHVRQSSSRATTLVRHSLSGTGAWLVEGEKLARQDTYATTHWERRKDFVIFLSHYKLEAGSAARALKLAVRHTIPNYENPCYLDSDDLADLTQLFREGVRRSEVLLLLATAGTFSRPWCLAEIYCAAALGLPVLLVVLDGGGFDLGKTKRLLEAQDDAAFEAALDAENEGAHEELSRILRDMRVVPPTQPDAAFRRKLLSSCGLEAPGTSVSSARLAVPASPSRRGGSSSPALTAALTAAGHAAGSLRFAINSSHNAIQADLMDIFTALAICTGRPPLEWSGVGKELAPDLTGGQQASGRRTSLEAVHDPRLSRSARHGSDLSENAVAGAAMCVLRQASATAITNAAGANATDDMEAGLQRSPSCLGENSTEETARYRMQMMVRSTMAANESPSRKRASAARERLRSTIRVVTVANRAIRSFSLSHLSGSSGSIREDPDSSGRSIVGLGSVTLADQFESEPIHFNIVHEETAQSIDASRLLQTAVVASRSNVSCVIDDAGSNEDLSCRSFVRRSSALILMLTKNCLLQPRCLLFLYLARRARKGIVLIAVEGGGFDFHEMMRTLQRLDTRMTSAARKELTSLLSDPDVCPPLANGRSPTINALGGELSRFLPSLIAIKLRQRDAGASETHCKAVAKDVLERYTHARTSKLRRYSGQMGSRGSLNVGTVGCVGGRNSVSSLLSTFTGSARASASLRGARNSHESVRNSVNSVRVEDVDDLREASIVSDRADMIADCESCISMNGNARG